MPKASRTLLVALFSLASLAGFASLVSCSGGSDSNATTTTAQPATTNSSTTANTTTANTTAPAASTTPTAVTCDASLATPEKLVCLANAFKATLSPSDQTLVQLEFTKANAVRWSNLPASMSARNGVKFGNLSATSLAAAQTLLQTALGPQGEASRQSFLLADDVLGTVQSNGYGSANYYLAFIGSPSTSGPWMIQFSGHHYTSQITMNGTTLSPTPMFIAIEPQTFTVGSASYEPMGPHRVALYDLLGSLDSAQQLSAKLTGTYTDLVVTPGRDGQFPTTPVGLSAVSLTAAQQAKLRTAIEAWVKNVDPSIAEGLLSEYLSPTALTNTYIGWTGAVNATPAQNAYVRIDGPRLWIEFSAQRGIIYPTQIHFHSVWRDKQRDYGGQFSF